MRYVPPNRLTIGTAGFLIREDIEVRGLRNIIGAQEWGYATMGHRLCGFTTDNWTTLSATYTQANGTTGNDLSAYSPTIVPYRADRGGYQVSTPHDTLPASGKYLLEILCYGSDLDIRVSLYGLANGWADPFDPIDTVITLGSSKTWYNAHVVVELEQGGTASDYQAFRLEVFGKVNGKDPTLRQVEVWEPQLAWMSSWGLTPELYGDEWVGYPLTNTDPVTEWAPDGALATWTEDGGVPSFVRDGVRTNVHSVYFDTNDWLISPANPPTETTLDASANATMSFTMEGSAGLVSAIALYDPVHYWKFDSSDTF